MRRTRYVGAALGIDTTHIMETQRLTLFDHDQFMNESAASAVLAESLLTLIREQRHKATRTIIATQEPTVSPKLLDLCSMTLVHRFTSPEWLTTLKKHLATGDNAAASKSLFGEIVGLNVGEALLFAPAAMLDVEGGSVQKLGMQRVRFRTRKRITNDGGRSILAVACGV